MAIKISFIGTHGTGKTTLVNELLRDPKFKDFNKMEDSLSDAGRMYEKGILDKLDPSELQLLFLAKHMYRCSTHSDLITDRSALDALCYAYYSYHEGNIPLNILEFIEDETEDLLQYYNVLFWVRPEFELKGENKRPDDREYQLKIDKIFESYIKLFELKNVVQLTGSIEDRIEQVYKKLYELQLIS